MRTYGEGKRRRRELVVRRYTHNNEGTDAFTQAAENSEHYEHYGCSGKSSLTAKGTFSSQSQPESTP